MEIKVNTSIPISFEKVDSFDSVDLRFTKVKIWLCHTGENLNRSVFDKAVIESMLPSLANIPILGYISIDNFNTADFQGHEQRLVIEDEGISIEYLGRAYGLIPETNNATFEAKICEDGIEREFLVCDGILWNKFQDAIDIFDRDSVKSQSMELQPDSIKGSFGKDKLFHFTSAQFEGACILGTGIIPAMTGSVVEKFTYTDIKNEINEMINEYISFSASQNSLQLADSDVAEVIKEEGGTNLDKVIEMLQKYNLTVEDLALKDIKVEDFSLEELEEKVKLFEVISNTTTETIEDNETVTNFSWSAEQLEDELRRIVSQKKTMDSWGYECSDFYYVDHLPDENVVVVYDYDDRTYIGLNYNIDGDIVSVDLENETRYKSEWVKMNVDVQVEEFSGTLPSDAMEYSLKVKQAELTKQFEADKESAVSEVTTQLSELQAKFDELQAKYALTDSELASKLQAEREVSEEAIFSSFATSLTEDEMADVKSKKSEFSLQEIDDKLTLILGKKTRGVSANFTKLDDKKPLGYQIPIENKKSTGKDYDELFEKFGKKEEQE